MAGANPLWGTPRIHGELLKLGIAISERTVSRLLAQLSRPPSQPWRTFLANHLSALVSMDFFTVSTLTGRVLFVLVLMSHDRRRIVHVNVTEHPTSAWTAQQLVEAFPEDAAPRWLLRDRDSIYDDQVRRRIASLGITEVVSSPLSESPPARDQLTLCHGESLARRRSECAPRWWHLHRPVAIYVSV
jgi:transposase InsO family protein